jgi:hypothetical protein
MVKWAQPLLSMYIWPKQTKIKKKSIGEASYGESYRGRSAPPGVGFRWIKTTGASESLENLHVSLTYVYRCDEGWYMQYVGPRHGLLHRHMGF